MVEGRESWSPGEACPSPGCYTALSVPLDAACLFNMARLWHDGDPSVDGLGAAIKSPDYNFATDNCLLRDRGFFFFEFIKIPELLSVLCNVLTKLGEGDPKVNQFEFNKNLGQNFRVI